MADPLQQSRETLERNVSRLTNDALLKRWHEGGFDERALPLAEAEIAKRGLDTSDAGLAGLRRREANLARGLQARDRRRQHVRIAAIAVAIVALAIAAKWFGLT